MCRNAINPEIERIKQNGLFGPGDRKGTLGDALNVLVVAAGPNLLKIPKSFKAFFVLWLGLVVAGHAPMA